MALDAQGRPWHSIYWSTGKPYGKFAMGGGGFFGGWMGGGGGADY